MEIVSDMQFAVLVVFIIAMALFTLHITKTRRITLIHRLYFIGAILLIIWMLACIAIKFTDPQNTELLRLFDAAMYLGCSGAPVFSLLVIITFTSGEEKLPRYTWLLFVVPVLCNIAVWTNPWHHLFYRVFSLYSTEVVFGPFLYLNGIYSSLCFLASFALIAWYAVRSQTRLAVWQSIIFSLANLIPLTISLLLSAKIIEGTVATTPLSLSFTVIFHGVAIFYLHFLDIKPMAIQKVLDWVSDCYLVTDNDSRVVSFNEPFRRVFGRLHGIRENTLLNDCLRDEDVENKTGIYNLLTAIESSRRSGSNIYYEQSVTLAEEDGFRKYFYLVEISPLVVRGAVEGYVSIFKDVTKVRESMQKLQDSQVRMMEQERLASLGQMMGGLAHNLKTPIMSISGSMSAVDNLLSECRSSLGDPDVTEDDYREIYGEIGDWVQKVRDSCTYMSDIISAVKGQASTMNTTDGGEFSADELLKRVSLLLRHELLNSGCSLHIDKRYRGDTLLSGDINNLVQVVNNLVSNAIDAQRQSCDHTITVVLERDEQYFRLMVCDRGVGVPPDIRSRLFKQMITNKGARGTGLGIYISNAVIRGRFGGFMWLDDNPGGGSIFGFSIPRENVTIIPQEAGERAQ